MTDERFEQLMRDAAKTYRRPPEAPLDEMWASISAQVEGRSNEPFRVGDRRSVRLRRYVAIAATLVIGVALGRASSSVGKSEPVATAEKAADAREMAAADEPYQKATSRYLGQTAALLIALPSRSSAVGTDSQFVTRAGDLLTTTRLLLDSPAAKDPAMRSLLEDLELVLAQVVRLRANGHNRTELDLINQALEQRDLIPRLQANISAN